MTDFEELNDITLSDRLNFHLSIRNMAVDENSYGELDEIRYWQGPQYANGVNKHPVNDIEGDLPENSIIYKGNKYNLHLVMNKYKWYVFIITDKKGKHLFYQNAHISKNIVKLRTRVNDSKEALFSKMIGTLLNLGFRVIDDANHNDKSINSIRKMLNHSDIEVYHNNKLLSIDEWEEMIKIDDLDILFEYRWLRGNAPLLEAWLPFSGVDVFDIIDGYYEKSDYFDVLLKGNE